MARFADFTIERAALLAALDPLNKVVEKRNTIPILSNVLIRAEGGSLHLTATDLDIQISMTVEAEIRSPGEFTVEAGTLFDIVRKFRDGAQIIVEQPTTGTAGNVAIVRSGRSRFTLYTLPVENYPDISSGGTYPHTIQIAGATFARLLAQVEFCISTEETRYYLNGTYLHVAEVDGKRILRAVATDGARLGRADATAAAGLTPNMKGIIIPRKAAGELKRLCEATGEAQITLSISEAKLRAEAGDTLFVTKLIDGTYPDYARVIPTANPHRLHIGLADLAGALARVRVVEGKAGGAVKLALSEAAVELSFNNPDSGKASDEVEATYDGPPISIGFKGKFLAEMLGQFDSETIVARFADPGSPAVFSTKDDADHLFILMPMRV